MRNPASAEAEIGERYLLQCVVEVANAAFLAKASSVFLVDEATGDLVFEAVAGEGEDHLIGKRFGGGTGLAGSVVATGQPIIADELAETSFSPQAAEETGYLPQTILAAPVIHEGSVIGVLEILDRQSRHDELEALELAGLLSVQAAAGIALVQRLRGLSRQPEDKHTTSGSNHSTILEGIAASLGHLNADEEHLLSQLLVVADGISTRATQRDQVPGLHLSPRSSDRPLGIATGQD
jgi:GAF domain-containing protein